MARWEPDSRGRLAQAALELYAERGFEQHDGRRDRRARAGLTERTFFRHFADKREVLFAGSEPCCEEAIVRAVARRAAPPPSPLDAVGAGSRRPARSSRTTPRLARGARRSSTRTPSCASAS